MQRRRFDQQLELIRVTVANESRRLEPLAMADVRMRAFAILADLEEQAGTDAELLEEIEATRRSLG